MKNVESWFLEEKNDLECVWGYMLYYTLVLLKHIP